MTTPIGATPPVQTIADLTGTGSAAKVPKDAMGSDTFLKLLVAQLKYQDPSKPADGTALLGQTAQFQMVEKLQLLTDQNTQMLAEQAASSAIALVGRNISYTKDGKTLSGVVGSVKLTAAGPVLEVGQTEVPLSSVTEITSAPAPAAAAIRPTTGTTPTTGTSAAAATDTSTSALPADAGSTQTT